MGTSYCGELWWSSAGGGGWHYGYGSRRPDEGIVRWRNGIMEFSLEDHTDFTFKNTEEVLQVYELTPFS